MTEIKPGTPLPWETDTLRLTETEWAEAREDAGQTIVSHRHAEGMVSEVLACVIGRNREEGEQRAAYIVTACNAYPSVITGLREAREALGAAIARADKNRGGYDYREPECQADYDRCVATLAHLDTLLANQEDGS